jgi:UbiA prenyltransferase family
VNPNLLAWAQLLRIPNVFTAFADILMVACVTGAITQRLDWVVLVLAASGCFYCGGMVLNDCFDRADDARSRPFRPIPSGRVRARTAASVGGILLLLGLGLVALVGQQRTFETRWAVPPYLQLGFALGTMILAYNSWLKHTFVGPFAMGACRFLNVLLGAILVMPWDDAMTTKLLHLASTTGVYIVGVTWFARQEETTSKHWHLIVGSLLMLAALALGLTLPAHQPSGSAPIYFPYLLVAFGFFIGTKLLTAIRSPGPKEVQTAVKRCILGLVALDAILATTTVGAWGLLILLLLLPARWLGKWVYST